MNHGNNSQVNHMSGVQGDKDSPKETASADNHIIQKQSEVPRQPYENEPLNKKQVAQTNSYNGKSDRSHWTIKNPMELTWRNLLITATVDAVKPDENNPGKTKKVVETLTILNHLNGTLRPGQFTAILGPSGSGKTTLLNFLSGRLVSPNMKITGELLLNNHQISDIDKFSNKIAYVMQDDILLATFTPREAFMFIANMRLKDLSHEQKVKKVEDLIIDLGLTSCANTKVGNQLIRGISGGERKRTSIGVELLTDPSMLFLDEPTTGLDSSTSQQVIELLKTLSIKGVNVVSTIHQPSSEIFALFQRLLLLVRGNIIYQGEAQEAVNYFSAIGFQCPDYSNPADFFMKIMNEEGLLIEKMQKGEPLPEDDILKKEFDVRLKGMLTSYDHSDQVKDQEPLFTEQVPIGQKASVSWFTQFFHLLKRGFLNEIRNPLDVKLKTFQAIFFGVACIIVFYDLGSGYAGIQNRNGVIFFIVTMQAFGGVQGTLSTFSVERPLFLRERMSKTYEVGPYFWGKGLSEFPFQLLYPILTVCIVYHAIGLNTVYQWKFFLFNLINMNTYWCGASYGLFLSVLIPRMELAMALVPVLVIPLMVMGGFFVNVNTVPVWLRWIQYLSFFKYGFHSGAWNEYLDAPVGICGCKLDDGSISLDTDIPNCDAVPCDPLGQLDMTESLETNMIVMFFLGLGLRILAMIFMYIISNPKRVQFSNPSKVHDEPQKAIKSN